MVSPAATAFGCRWLLYKTPVFRLAFLCRTLLLAALAADNNTDVVPDDEQLELLLNLLEKDDVELSLEPLPSLTEPREGFLDLEV